MTPELPIPKSREPRIMMHAFIDIGDKTMCSRCGNEVLRGDEICPAISDGAIYASRSHETPCEAFIPGVVPEVCLVCRYKLSSH